MTDSMGNQTQGLDPCPRIRFVPQGIGMRNKLERELGISLKEKVSDVKVEKRAYNQGLTLSDFVKKE